MSFILDALKKSEIERQRQAIPGLMDSRPAPPRARFPLWALALVALLAVNLTVLAIVIVRSGAPTARASREVEPASAVPPGAAAAAPSAAAQSAAAPSAATAPPAAASLPPAPAADHFSPMDGAPVYAPEIPTVPPAAGPPAPAYSGNSPAYPAVPRHAARLPDPVLSQEDDKSGTEVLPSINEINLIGQQALPPLHLDVHVYATNPADRFVYINMQRYREGATLAEGPVLERIRRDGVVLNYNGLRFVLPRQQ